MNGLWQKIREYRDKKRYDVILQGRFHLTDYEKYLLVPELKARLEVLKGRFSEIIQLCELQKNSTQFNRNINSIINPAGLPSDPNESVAEAFFNGVKAQAQKEGVGDIDRILNQHKNIGNVSELGAFLDDVNILSSSLLTIKNRLFLFKIEAYPIATHTQTGQVITAQPNQYFVTTEPFQISIDGILGIARAISDTIDEWHKYSMKLKTQYLDLYINRLSVRNTKWVFYINLLTVLLAVSLSAFFLISNDPFNLYKKNRELESKILMLEHQNELLNLGSKK